MRASTIDLLCGEQKRLAATPGSNKLGIHYLYAEMWVLNSVYRLFSSLQLISDIKYTTFLSIWGILGRIWGYLGSFFRVHWYTTTTPSPPPPHLADPDICCSKYFLTGLPVKNVSLCLWTNLYTTLTHCSPDKWLVYDRSRLGSKV